MNKIKPRLISALLVLTLLAMIPAAAFAATVTHSIPGGQVYLRSGPGTNYASRGTVTDGDHIRVLQNGSVWSKVRTDDHRTGYIKNGYIRENGSKPNSGTCYYTSARSAATTTGVNLRSGASTSTAIVASLKKGTKLRLLGENGDFYLAETKSGRQGYVYKRCVASSAPAQKTRVTTAFVHMRKGGGMHYDVLRTVPMGETVQVLSVGNYWTKCVYRGATGWIKNIYLK